MDYASRMAVELSFVSRRARTQEGNHAADRKIAPAKRMLLKTIQRPDGLALIIVVLLGILDS